MYAVVVVVAVAVCSMKRSSSQPRRVFFFFVFGVRSEFQQVKIVLMNSLAFFRSWSDVLWILSVLSLQELIFSERFFVDG